MIGDLIGNFVIIFIIYGTLFFVMGVPVILTTLNILNIFLKKKIKPQLVNGLIMVMGPLLSLVLYAEWDPRDYNLPLRLPIDLDWHAPVASWHMPTLLTLAALALISYIILTRLRFKIPPLMIVLSMSFMMIGCALGIVWMVQLSPHFFERGRHIKFEALYLCLFPLNFMICAIVLVRNLMREYVEDEEKPHYNNEVLNKCHQLLSNSNNWPKIAIILSIPLLIIVIAILVLFGQQPDAIIKAFTETSDWLLSQKISPPPVIHETNGHYLCTVSLRGHKKLVKPLRYGIRGNEKIIVNRQLCIANAFEQLIQEGAPRTHKLIRSLYDQYGYPLSKHITNAYRADITYILMKPLEWFFLITLYLLDRKPENRIARQYLPMAKK